MHRIATRPGKMNEELFNTRRRITGNQPIADAKKAWEAWKKEVAQELVTSAGFVTKWYKLLVNASSLVFEIEHLLRRKRVASGTKGMKSS